MGRAVFSCLPLVPAPPRRTRCSTPGRASTSETFFEHARESYDAPLPKYVRDELRGYLRCALLRAPGFCARAASRVIFSPRRVGGHPAPCRLSSVGFRVPLSEPGVHLSLCTGLSLMDAKSGRRATSSGRGSTPVCRRRTTETAIAPLPTNPAFLCSRILRAGPFLTRMVFLTEPSEDGPPRVVVERELDSLRSQRMAIEGTPAPKKPVQIAKPVGERLSGAFARANRLIFSRIRLRPLGLGTSTSLEGHGWCRTRHGDRGMRRLCHRRDERLRLRQLQPTCCFSIDATTALSFSRCRLVRTARAMWGTDENDEIIGISDGEDDRAPEPTIVMSSLALSLLRRRARASGAIRRQTYRSYRSSITLSAMFASNGDKIPPWGVPSRFEELLLGQHAGL